MSKYTLPELRDGWLWFVNATNPNAVEIWVYKEDGLFKGMEYSSVKALLGTVEAGYNEPSYVANQIHLIAEKSMNWGTWSQVGAGNQDSLYDLLFGKDE